MMMVRKINRKAAASRWSSTGIAPPCAHHRETRAQAPDLCRWLWYRSRGHHSEPAKTVLAATSEISPTEGHPPQSP